MQSVNMYVCNNRHLDRRMLTDTMHPLDSVNHYKWKKELHGYSLYSVLPRSSTARPIYMLAAYSDW